MKYLILAIIDIMIIYTMFPLFPALFSEGFSILGILYVILIIIGAYLVVLPWMIEPYNK